MTKKVRKPRSPKIAEELFVGIPGNPLEPRPHEELEVQEGTMADAVNELLGLPPKIDEIAPTNTLDPPSEDSVDEYIRKQVTREMYGTETPSEYDIISLAIKRRL